MGIIAMPAPVVEKNISFGKGFTVYGEENEFFKGQWMEQDAKRVGRVPEFVIIQLLADIHGKARTQRHYSAAIIDGITAFRDRYRGGEVHVFSLKFQPCKVTKFVSQ